MDLKYLKKYQNRKLIDNVQCTIDNERHSERMMGLMFRVIRNNRGDIATPILTMLGIVTIVGFLVLTFDKLAPAAVYIKANQVVRKYSLIMENEGGFSKEDKDKMIAELAQKGIKVGDSDIKAPESVNYGEDLTLELSFDYQTSELTMSGFDVSRVNKSIPMKISRSTVSRR